MDIQLTETAIEESRVNPFVTWEIIYYTTNNYVIIFSNIKGK